MKITAKRVGRQSPYALWEQRCVYAVETMRSVNASVAEQLTELETMLLDDADTDERCFLNWHKRYMAKIRACIEKVRSRRQQTRPPLVVKNKSQSG